MRTGAVLTVTGLVTYVVGGLALAIPGAVLMASATVRHWPRELITITRILIVVATVFVWPITWIGVGLVGAPVAVPLFVWAVKPFGDALIHSKRVDD